MEQNKKPYWEVTWDYLGWKGQKIHIDLSQEEWIQTLATKINELSAQIYMSTLIGPADTVIVNPSVFKLIEQLEYFDQETKQIGKRFHVIIDDSVQGIVVCRVEGVKGLDVNTLSKLIGVIKIKNL